MMSRLSLTARLTLLFAAISASTLVVFSWLIVSAIEQHFVDLDREELAGGLELVRADVAGIDSEAGLQRLPQELATTLASRPMLLVTVIDPDGDEIDVKPGMAIPRRFVRATGRIFDWREAGQHYRGLAAAFATQLPQPPTLVAVAIDVGHHDAFIAHFDRSLALFVGAAVIVSGILGWLAARRGLAPLAVMKAGAAAVTPRKLDLRLSLASVPVEMADLADTLNTMLERLELAFHRLSDFSSDLAHELRTPIANLMMQTQVALSQPRSAQVYRDILASNAEEFERLSRMISDMLFLAKAEHGLMLPSYEEIDLCREARALFEYYEALAAERQIAMRCQGGGSMVGDPPMIRRAFGNLLSNALRHTADGGYVAVALRKDPDAVVISVENSGETIDPTHMARLFERFYRIDSSRARDDALGAGLGLAIVKAIVEAHGGVIGGASSAGTTRFTMSFPAAGGHARRAGPANSS